MGYFSNGVNGDCPVQCHTFDPDAISISWQSGESYSCDYAYGPESDTGAAWDSPGTPGASSESFPHLPAIPDPLTPTISASCREFFVARESDGSRGVSFGGMPYDCRYVCPRRAGPIPHRRRLSPTHPPGLNQEKGMVLQYEKRSTEQKVLLRAVHRSESHAACDCGLRASQA